MPAINVVWFKRDLRLTDHRPLMLAAQAGIPVLLVAFKEPSLERLTQYDKRHWRFIQESIDDINQRLDGHLHFHYGEVLPFFQKLVLEYQIQKVFSYRETGVKVTYDRDIQMGHFFKENGIEWNESDYAGVLRGRKDRSDWRRNWYKVMSQPLDEPDLGNLDTVRLDPGMYNMPYKIPPDKNMQPGGRQFAEMTLNSFLNDRINNYNKHISKPLESRNSCSRLSAYLAWGNYSVREVYQAVQANAKLTGRRNTSFMSRLRWHCHFIQKFESEDRYETENINRGYNVIRTKWNESIFESWKNGTTGYPLVDACIRCVRSTGYLNFRMRAMLVSFLTHHLWLDWKRGADWLASMFLDFEPGIHYAQFQMQAGVTGINTIRIYNPVKQGYDHDTDGKFIAEWIPELEGLPVKYRHEPWKMSPIEQQMYGVVMGEDYPHPVIDHQITYRRASSELYRLKRDPVVKKEAARILKRHTVKGRKV